MIVTAREFTSAAEMRAAATATHRRLFNPTARPKTIRAAETDSLVSVAPSKRQLPLWNFEETVFDAHVVQYRSRRVEIAANPAKVHIKDRCRELGTTYKVMIGADRRYKTVAIRHQLMWEVHQRFGLSFPAIGRLFGGRDHTTALSAIRKVEAKRGEA